MFNSLNSWNDQSVINDKVENTNEFINVQFIELMKQSFAKHVDPAITNAAFQPKEQRAKPIIKRKLKTVNFYIGSLIAFDFFCCFVCTIFISRHRQDQNSHYVGSKPIKRTILEKEQNFLHFLVWPPPKHSTTQLSPHTHSCC